LWFKRFFLEVTLYRKFSNDFQFQHDKEINLCHLEFTIL